MSRGNIYIAGPMRGYREFNFPAFFTAQDILEAEGWTTFNPAARDNEVHGTDIGAGNETGSLEQAAEEHGFSLRDALGADTAWISHHADAIYLLDGWENSPGARAEKALAEALGHQVLYQTAGGEAVLTPREQTAYDDGLSDGYDNGYQDAESEGYTEWDMLSLQDEIEDLKSEIEELTGSV